MRTPRPARQTGRMRAFSRRDVTGCELTSGLEPGELVERVPGELTRDCRDEGTTPPREAVFVPTGEGRDGDAVVRRVNEPTVAEVDAHVVYLRGLRRRAVDPEEDDVGRLELLERDALRGGHFSAHRVRRPALEHVREGAPVRVLLDLV